MTDEVRPDGRSDPAGGSTRLAVARALLDGSQGGRWIKVAWDDIDAKHRHLLLGQADAVLELLGPALDPDNVRGALIGHQVFRVAYRTDAEIQAAQEALIDTLVGLRPPEHLAHLPNRHGESVTIDLDELERDQEAT